LVADTSLGGKQTTADLMVWFDARPELHSIQRVMFTGGMSLADQQGWLDRGIGGVLLKARRWPSSRRLSSKY
jgi:hypothetical protein